MRGDCPRGTSQVKGTEENLKRPKAGFLRLGAPRAWRSQVGFLAPPSHSLGSHAPEQVFEVLFSFVGFSKIVSFYRKTDPRLEA